jgi:hypothetical protein
MPTPSKFTARRRDAILQLLAVGASRRAAARAAGIHHATPLRWLSRGQTAAPGGRWSAFYDAVIEAECHAGVRELALADPFGEDPVAAVAFLRRSEPEVWGSHAVSETTEPVVIQLTLDRPEDPERRGGNDERPARTPFRSAMRLE